MGVCVRVWVGKSRAGMKLKAQGARREQQQQQWRQQGRHARARSGSSSSRGSTSASSSDRGKGQQQQAPGVVVVGGGGDWRTRLCVDHNVLMRDEPLLQQGHERQLHARGVAPRVGHQPSAAWGGGWAGGQAGGWMRDGGREGETASPPAPPPTPPPLPTPPRLRSLVCCTLTHPLTASRCSSVRPYTASLCSSTALCSWPYLAGGGGGRGGCEGAPVGAWGACQASPPRLARTLHPYPRPAHTHPTHPRASPLGIGVHVAQAKVGRQIHHLDVLGQRAHHLLRGERGHEGRRACASQCA